MGKFRELDGQLYKEIPSVGWVPIGDKSAGALHKMSSRTEKKNAIVGDSHWADASTSF